MWTQPACVHSKKFGCVMRLLGNLIICAALSFTGFGGAFAQTIDDETKCAVVAKIMDGPSQDKQKVDEMIGYIISTMGTLDHAYGLKGRPEIIPQMTEDGRTGIALIVASRCRSQGGMTIEDMALQTYVAVRAMKSGLGFSEPQRTQASARITQRFWRASVPGRRQTSRTTIRSAQGERRWFAFE
jgi:hypothetical protein